MKIIRTYIREGLFERNINWDNNVNLVFSHKNTCGKTTLLRALLFSLGYPIPNTRNIKFENCIVITEVDCKKGHVLIRREGEYLQVSYGNNEDKYFLPHDQLLFHKFLWDTDNIDVLENVIGSIYIDQEKGWTLLNRGKVIGSIKYNIDQLVRGLSDRDCSDLVFRERHIENELKKYKQMLNISKYKEEINDIKDELVSVTYEEDLQKELEVLNYEQFIQMKELKRIDNVIKKNESFRKYIESMKIRVRASNGEEVPVNKDTIIDMNEYTDMLETKRRMIAGQITRLGNKIDKIRLELPLPSTQLSFVDADTTLREFDKSIAKFNIDAVTVNNIIDKLKNDRKQIKAQLAEATRRNNKIADEMFGVVMQYAQELNIGVEERTSYLFTSNLKELSGAVLHKLVFSYRLACIIEIEKKLGYKLPIIIDSPSGKEVDRENVNAMMKILSRDFKDNQIIVSSIYEYDFDKVHYIKMEGRLVDQQIEVLIK